MRGSRLPEFIKINIREQVLNFINTMIKERIQCSELLVDNDNEGHY